MYTCRNEEIIVIISDDDEEEENPEQNHPNWKSSPASTTPNPLNKNTNTEGINKHSSNHSKICFHNRLIYMHCDVYI